ncbi:MAG: SGNH/GDSL hydrolase family protein [Bacteroides sp.]|nr:SGNH/GDSL hydrolase family protein [Bacteroides sp.]
MIKHFLILLIGVVSTLQLPAQLQWKNPLAESFQTVHGQAWQDELKGTYYRLPERAKEVVRKPVWGLSRHSAGLSIVFRSNAPEIKVRYAVTEGFAMAHMPATGKSGVDLYATDANGKLRWCAAKYAFGDTITYTYSHLSYVTAPKQGYEYQLFLPPYNEIKWLEIGVDKEYTLRFLPASKEKPIVLYGTSIAQGACASRPGMVFGNIINRTLQHPVVNLGFSGNGQMEPEVFDFLSEIDAKMFILDNMPNMNKERTGLIYERATNGIRKLRQKSNAPILLVEHNGYANEFSSLDAEDSYRKTNIELRRVYQTLKAEGIKELYYLTKEEIGFTQDATVEAIHPSDLGMQIYADAYIPKIKEILQEDADSRTVFQPCMQQRDSYDWKERHEQVLKLNKEQAPDVLLIGNSITHYWAGEPTASLARGTDSWNQLFKGKVVRNLGFGWDRIENALWRIYHGELDGYEAQKVVLLMGTNNLEQNTDDEIIDGINELVRAVRHRQPQAQIYVTGILPRAWHEPRVAALNQMIQIRLLANEATYVDLSAAFLQSDGRIINELFTDGLHPNKEGYQRMAEMLEKAIKE